MKNIRVFLSENFQFLEVKFSIYLNRCVFVMISLNISCKLPPKEIICIKCKNLFSGKNRKTISKYCLLNFYQECLAFTTVQPLYNNHSMEDKQLVVAERFIYTCSRTTHSEIIKLAVIIMKTCLYTFDPLKPHFYIVKLGFTGVYIVVLISAQKHRLWVLVRTALQRRF